MKLARGGMRILAITAIQFLLTTTLLADISITGGVSRTVSYGSWSTPPGINGELTYYRELVDSLTMGINVGYAEWRCDPYEYGVTTSVLKEQIYHIIPVIRTTPLGNKKINIFLEWGLGYFYYIEKRDVTILMDTRSNFSRHHAYGFKMDFGINFMWFEIKPGFKALFFDDEVQDYFNLSVGFCFE